MRNIKKIVVAIAMLTAALSGAESIGADVCQSQLERCFWRARTVYAQDICIIAYDQCVTTACITQYGYNCT